MLNFCTSGGKEKQKKNKFNIKYPIYRSIESNKLYRYPDDYIDLIIMTKFELSSNRNFSPRLRER